MVRIILIINATAIMIAGKNTKLDAVELAMGEELIKSSKRRRELIELSFNR